MKRTLMILVMLLLCVTGNSQRIAVLDFNAGVGVSQADVDGLSAIFNTYFSPRGYTLVERTQIDKAIDEQNFQRGKFTESQMVRIGQILNVSNVVVGDVNIVAGQYNVDVRVINVQSGTIQATEGATWTSGTSYRNMMKSIAEKLANKIAINPVTPTSAPVNGGNTSVSLRKRTSVETIYGYLKVFPEEIGNFDSEPRTVINQLNNQSVHGYNTWRIPTNEELSLLRANGYLSGAQYMTKESPRGLVLLVTDKAEKAQTHGNINGHEYVDLGLSVKWATCNVGANKPEDYGNYYAWGETSTKSSYTESNSKTYGKQMYDIKGNSQYDAARANWGGSWRLPTKTECQELVDRCTWKWTTQNGVNGYKVTGPNGNSIFLSAAGRRYESSLYGAGELGYYWSSTPIDGYDNNASYIFFNSVNTYMNNYNRYYGRSVRPVSE
ncbi:MAG: DUF1566 domain-containing protein [Lentimicrobiaceae bacterium]|nr:DUF1566 domain-containing protein [Lentimicrobiaceae bacterium]